MKAAVLETWNTIELKDINKPTLTEYDALVKVIYGGVCGSDIVVYSGQHPTAVTPVVLCHEILGVVEKLPEKYDGKIQVGDRVLINPVISCGVCEMCKSGAQNVCYNLEIMGIHVDGGFQEYTKVNVSKLVTVDKSLEDNVAVLGEPSAVASHVNRRSEIKPGHKVLIAGAGTIGLVTALTAMSNGADVYISEINEDRIRLADKLGIKTINPIKKDIIDEMKSITDGRGFDVVVDATGAKVSIKTLPDLCKVRGTMISMGLSGAAYEFVIGKVSFKEQRLIGSRLYSQSDFENGVSVMNELNKQIDLSKIVTDIMKLDDIEQAIEMMKNGKNVGKIVIEM